MSMFKMVKRFIGMYAPIESLRIKMYRRAGVRIGERTLFGSHIFLDVMFSAIFILYLFFRFHEFGISDEDEAAQWARTALDILSCGAPILIPRLAFNVMSENMLFLSLRAMMSDFFTLTALAVWCFAGFLLSLKWLQGGVQQVGISTFVHACADLFSLS